jgi:hypothetical protein
VTVRGVGSLDGADAALDTGHFDAALFDVRALPAPEWYHTLERLTSSSPAPVLVAWGDDLTAFDGFHLGRLGVRLLLPRRPAPEQAHRVLREALDARPAFDPHVRAIVGHAPLVEVVDRVRRLFLDQGLGLKRDDRSKTARLLGVSRQAIQQMIRRNAEREEQEPAQPTELPALETKRASS